MKKISLVLIYNNEDKNIVKSVESLQNQIISDFELLCVNTSEKINANEKLQSIAEVDKRIKLYNIPLFEDENEIKKTALMLSNGEYIVFLPVYEFSCDYLSLLYQSNVIKNEHKFKIEEEKFYKRDFLENYEKIEDIIEEKVEGKLEKFIFEAEKLKDEFSVGLDELSKAHSLAIDNKVYDLSIKFANLKDNIGYMKNECENIKQQIRNELEEKEKNINERIIKDVTCIYEKIKAETDLKGAEISRVYEEITKNYQYTEKLTGENRNYVDTVLVNDKQELKNKLYDLEKDIVVRYVNLKRMLESRSDELDSRIKAITGSGNFDNLEAKTDFIDYEKVLNESIENIYMHINSTNAEFYKELSQMYGEINSKLVEKIKGLEILHNNRIYNLKEEMAAEIDRKINELRNELK